MSSNRYRDRSKLPPLLIRTSYRVASLDFGSRSRHKTSELLMNVAGDCTSPKRHDKLRSKKFSPLTMTMTSVVVFFSITMGGSR